MSTAGGSQASGRADHLGGSSAGRVLLVSNHAEVIGGGETSYLTLLKGLRGSAWEPVALVPGAGEVADACRDLGVELHLVALPRLRAPSPGVLFTAGKIRRLIEHEPRCALVHANGSRAMLYAGWAARRAGVPCVWHVRILDQDPLLDPVLVRLATAVVSSSGTGIDRFERWPWVERHFHVIPNGLDLDAFEPSVDRAAVRAALGLPEAASVAVSVGRLIAEKTPELLVDAAQLASGDETPLRWLIVGDGPLRETLEARVRAAGLQDEVRLLGHRTDIADILDACDVFVMTSAIDHFGRVVIEAMYRGLPVVAVNAGGPAEIVVDGETGVLIAPGDARAMSAAVRRLVRDAGLRARMGRAGRERVQRCYSLRRHVGRMTELYDELTGARRRA